MSDLDKYKVNVPEKPRQRIPLHAQKPLMVAEREGYKRYIMNNVPGARERFEIAGYTPVMDKAANISDKNINHGKELGKELILNVNKGINAPCNTATVMEIPLEWYIQDQAEAQKKIDITEEALDPSKHSVHGSTYGALHKGKDDVEK